MLQNTEFRHGSDLTRPLIQRLAMRHAAQCPRRVGKAPVRIHALLTGADRRTK